ncbi:hypothetical protein BTA51_28230 [Hahella sp. CCB-MM4]|uniref:COG4315 family predicted lipoprotein n=1 Tax=Hahella sp. (strain CCB-MM4) TaxID=1926491 RepID=UPI000B9B4C5A|nr:hypothetical protein [Hahella sp. CCB-MM4]OZG70018.1 hypothetical protein BTA51_28230 [Hahella sp. CCB-MM4]
MKLTTLATIATLSVATLGSLNVYAEGKADSVDYFAKDKNYYGSSASYDYGSNQVASNTTQNASANRVVSKVNTSIGEVFATAKGMTLYTFTKDGASVSNCYDGCAGSWPPFLAKANAKTWGAFTVIERKDGTYQWAYKNQPLYTWVGDREQGDTTGHGVGKVWYAAQP